MKNDSDSEGVILVCGMVVIFCCITGSMATGIGPVEFFFIGSLILALVSIVIGIFVLAIIIAVKVSVEAHKEGGRTLKQILVQDYSPKALMGDYYVVVTHMQNFGRELGSEGLSKMFAKLEENPRFVAYRDYTRNLLHILFSKDKR